MEPLSRKIHPRLPIFELRDGDSCVVYTPGHVAPVAPAEAEALRRHFENGTTGGGPLARQLSALAAEAEIRWLDLAESPFAPECLTVYLSNHCNLGCVYCYSAGPEGLREQGWERGGLPVLDPRAVEGAARIVAANCERHHKPFHLVIHGGGEPTLHWTLLQEVVAVARRAAAERGLEVESYISTSGVIPEARARWLAANFSRVSLSVDGPPDVQDAQRPRRSGEPTWPAIERTARVFRETGVRFTVRATVTRATLYRQAEILAYLHEHLGAREFAFEPAYRPHAGASWGLHSPEDAARFADHFLAAQRVADVLGCELETSGVRLDEIHGPFCNVLRNTLHLTPDGAAVSCFVCTDGTQPRFASHSIGRWEPGGEAFVIDDGRAAALRSAALAVPERCRSCHNVYHCARECPDLCPTPLAADPTAPGGFRCEVQRRLGRAWILGTVEDTGEGIELEPGEARAAAELLSETPAGVSAHAIAKQWAGARRRCSLTPRRAPDPVWAVRGFEMGGEQAWAEIRDTIDGRMAPTPMSAYVHIPFCDRKCDFCDCYSLAVKDEAGDARLRQYTRALLREIEAWASLRALTRRDVTTVHFGGGTPTLLPHSDLKAIVEALKSNFNAGAGTEWALESTTTQLTPAGLERLRELGFTRLHVGVQTLEEPARRLAGRKESAAAVEAKLRAALDLGMVVTVDVIYGLPGQTTAGFVETLQRLDDLGVHGFSLYRLNLTAHNQPFALRHGLAERNRHAGFFLFQIGEAFLRARGYRKTHFAHFSRPPDRYLYYTHVRRGEDLLALGVTADGSFGPLNYRHPELSEYLRTLETGGPALAGATYETAWEMAVKPAVAGLMTASVSASALDRVGAHGLLAGWLADGLLRRGDSPGEFELTGSGSWLLSDMLDEVGATAEVFSTN